MAGVVVLAGTSGSRLFPVSEGVPKALLPVATQPLLRSLLATLRRCRAGRVVVVTTPRFESAVQTLIDPLADESSSSSAAPADASSPGERPLLEVVVIAVDEMLGSAGAVRQAMAVDETLRQCLEIVVIAGECGLGRRALVDVVETRRRRDAACAALFAAASAVDSTAGKKDAASDAHVEVVALDATTNILVEKTSLVDVEDRWRGDEEHPAWAASKAVLRRFPALEVRTDLEDLHVYAFDGRALRAALGDDAASSAEPSSSKQHVDATMSLKADLVPALATAYVRRRDEAPPSPSRTDDPIYGRYERLVATSNGNNNSHETPPAQHQPVGGPVVAVVVDAGTAKDDDDDADPEDAPFGADGALRVTTPAAFRAANRRAVQRALAVGLASTNPSKLLRRDSTLLGVDASVAERVTLKHATIGARCKIGARAKINNSVLFDDVTVGDGATIQNSILCAGATVKDKANLNDVQVGPGAVVPAGAALKHEAFVAASSYGDDDDDDVLDGSFHGGGDD